MTEACKHEERTVEMEIITEGYLKCHKCKKCKNKVYFDYQHNGGVYSHEELGFPKPEEILF